MSKQMRTRKRLLVTIAVLSIFLASLCGVAQAKYIHTAQLQGSVTVKADLGEVTVKEHQAIRKADGSYELGSEEVTSNSYILIPGLDVPKDPFVTVTNKSPIEAYVFVEVVSTLGESAITYEIDTDNWTELGITGKNSGKVYAYKNPVSANIGPIYILKDNHVTVGQKLLHMDTTDLGLTFYASMGQVAAGNTQADVYNSIT